MHRRSLGLLHRVLKPTFNLRMVNTTNIKSYDCYYSSVKQLFAHFSTQKPPINQSFKQQSKRFYNNLVEDIVELEKTEDWQTIIQQTKNPIIVEFYANWCETCKILTPKLEERVRKAGGTIKMLKINIDTFGQIAHELQIKTVPCVYLMYLTKPMDGFQGLLDEKKFDKFFDTIKNIHKISEYQEKLVNNLEEAKGLMESSKFQEAEKILITIPNSVKTDIASLKGALLAQCYLSMQNIIKFQSQMNHIEQYEYIYNQLPNLKEFYQYLRSEAHQITKEREKNPQIERLKQKANDGKLEDIFELGNAYYKHQMIEEALDCWLQILKKDKNWENKKVNKKMLQVLSELGHTSPIAQKYRKLIQRAMN